MNPSKFANPNRIEPTSECAVSREDGPRHASTEVLLREPDQTYLASGLCAVAPMREEVLTSECARVVAGDPDS